MKSDVKRKPKQIAKPLSARELAKRGAIAVKAAKELTEQKNMDWVTATNAMFGPAGEVIKLFPSPADRLAFATSCELATVDKILRVLPKPSAKSHGAAKSPEEVSGRILVRLPKSLHAALLTEAENEGISLNQLCLAKLALQLAAVIA